MQILRITIGALALVALLLGTAPVADAQTARRCFAETGYCISGRIREYWEQNGGLAVFGFPITALQRETIEGTTLQVQWFERNRLELHPQNARPYDVLLGRLSVDRIGQAGIASPGPRDRERQSNSCRFFPETGRNVCGDILANWRASGLNLDGQAGYSYEESLALFGLPLTDLRSERLSDGKSYQVQWFERGRFELHPQNKAPYNVLLGLLGSEASPVAQTRPDPSAASAPTKVADPTRMAIPAIEIDQRTIAVGLDRNNVPIVLDHDIAWYNRSARPGEGENIVFWGHVLRFRSAPNIPAPFARLEELEPGALLVITDTAGTQHRYRVTRSVSVTPDQVQWILPQGREMVTLVSCYGEQIINNGEVVDMSRRLITIAEPED